MHKAQLPKVSLCGLAIPPACHLHAAIRLAGPQILCVCVVDNHTNDINQEKGEFAIAYT